MRPVETEAGGPLCTRQASIWVVALVSVLAIGPLGCGGVDGPPSGAQPCAPEGSLPRCPSGYYCESSLCWRLGTGPDSASLDRMPPDLGGTAQSGAQADLASDIAMEPDAIADVAPDADSGSDTNVDVVTVSPSDTLPPTLGLAGPLAERKIVPFGIISRSDHFVAVRTLAQSPSTIVLTSEHYRVVRGIVGVTQAK